MYNFEIYHCTVYLNASKRLKIKWTLFYFIILSNWVAALKRPDECFKKEIHFSLWCTCVLTITRTFKNDYFVYCNISSFFKAHCVPPLESCEVLNLKISMCSWRWKKKNPLGCLLVKETLRHSWHFCQCNRYVKRYLWDITAHTSLIDSPFLTVLYVI